MTETADRSARQLVERSAEGGGVREIRAPDRTDRYVERTRTAVENLLSDSTFAELSVEAIINEAGMARSTFYVYFADKRQMLDVLTADLLEGALGVVSAWWDLSPDANYDELRAALAGFVSYFHTHRLLLKAVIDAETTDPTASGFASMVAAGQAGIAAHIRAGQHRGTVNRDIDADHVARWLVRMVDQGLYELVTPASGERLERLVDAMSMLIWNTLYRGTRG
jgi:AcrR family transcriptional regulator